MQPEHLLKALMEQPEGVVWFLWCEKIGVTPAVVLSETDQLIAKMPTVFRFGSGSLPATVSAGAGVEISYRKRAKMSPSG